MEGQHESSILPHRGILFQLRHNSSLVGTALLLSMIFWNFGFDGGIVSGILAMPAFSRDFATGRLPDGTAILTPLNISVITAVPSIGTLFALPFASFAADRWGRRVVVLIACGWALLAAALQIASQEIILFTVGRTFGNMAIFIYITLGGGWLAEIAPPEVRGVFVSLSIIVINCAGVVTASINQGTKNLSGTTSYRIPLGLQLAWPLIIAAGLWFVPDSPTFFLIKGKDDEAEKSLRSVRKGYTETEIVAELDALRAQKVLRQQEDPVSFLEAFRGTNLRRTLLSLSIANFQQLSGIAYATNYATIFLQQVAGGQDPFVLVIGLSILSLGGSVVGLLLVDKIGRRTLALTTFSALFVIDLVIGSLGFADPTKGMAVPKAIAAFCLMFGFFFAAGFGPLTYVVASEMPTARLRNKTNTISFLTLSCFATAVVYALPYLSQPNGANWGAKTYLLFAGWMFMVVIVTFFCLPETKGRSPAELDEMFTARVPARKFKTYVCGTATSNFVHAAEVKAVDTFSHMEISKGGAQQIATKAETE